MYRYLTHLGYNVRYVRNITDAGHLTDDTGVDKISNKAKLEKKEPMEIVQKFTVGFRDVMSLFNVLPPSIEPTATGHIIEQQVMIKKIIDNGLAYEKNGTVYFDVDRYSKSHNYTELTGRKLDELIDGSRTELSGQEEKKGRHDFALWIKAKPEHLMQWPSQWGMGFPGWHIECSAMSTKYLGEQFDIHGGGMDLQATHHTNEIAQNVAYSGKSPATYWVHTNMLTLNGKKMSKSDGNYLLPLDLFSGNHESLSKSYEPSVVRFFMMQAHYRSTLDISDVALSGSEKAFNRLMNAYKTLHKLTPSNISSVDVITLERKMYEAMDNDFDTSSLVAKLFEAVDIINNKPLTQYDIDVLKRIYENFVFDIMGLKLEENSKATYALSKVMDLVLELRDKAKSNKDYATSDEIRNKLNDAGIEVKDGKDNTNWTI
jgi:cysteinyl-tRNA synthetase